MTTPADATADERAFAACLAGRPVPDSASGLAAFTDAVRSSAAAPGRPNAALAELLVTGLLVPTQAPSRGTAGRPARTSRKRPSMLISTLVAKFAAAGAVAKAAAGTGVVVVALTGTATTVAPTPEPPSVVETTTTTTTTEESTSRTGPTGSTTDPTGEPTPPTIADPLGGDRSQEDVPDETAGTLATDTGDTSAEPEYRNHGQRVSEAAHDVADHKQMPDVAHENRDERRAERAAPAEEPAVQPAEQAPVVEQSAPAGDGKDKGKGNSGK